VAVIVLAASVFFAYSFRYLFPAGSPRLLILAPLGLCSALLLAVSSLSHQERGARIWLATVLTCLGAIGCFIAWMNSQLIFESARDLLSLLRS
jgi:hypothetical protein